jgi:hypothetical protein
MTQSDYLCVNKDYERIVTDGLVFNVDAGYTPSSPKSNYMIGDLGGTISYEVKNIALPLTNWVVKRSDISLITDGSIQPPFAGAQVWSSTINTSLYANTLHRMWSFGDQNGVIGTLGQGYYRYYMWVRGKSTNSSGATMNIDISDGSAPGNSGNIVIGTNEEWRLLSCWDNGGSSYNVSKWFDYFLTGVNGDTYYISGIAIVRSNVSEVADLKQMYTFPGYINYSGTKNSNLQGYFINGANYVSNDGGALTFDGIDDNIDFSNILSQYFTGTTPYSIEIWANQFVRQTGFRMALSNENSLPIGRDGICLTMSISSTNTQITHERFGSGNQGGVSVYVPYEITVGVPFNMFAVYDGSNVKVYFNSSYTDTRANNFTITNTTTPLRIGSRGSGSGNFFNGNVYVARVYNRELSPSEIFQNYQSQFTRFLGENIVTDGLVSYLDAGYSGSYPTTGTTWYDVSGYGRNGTLTNGPTYSNVSGGTIVFDGTDDYVTLGTQSFITNDFTVNLWYNLNTNTTKEHFLFSIGYSSGNSFLIVANSNLGSSQTLSSYYLNPGGIATGRTINSITVGNTVLVNLTYTRNNGLNVIYINGVEQTSRTFTESLSLGSSLQYILGYAIPRNKTTAYLQGNIYISQVYNRSLTQSEILQNFNTQKSRFGL